MYSFPSFCLLDVPRLRSGGSACRDSCVVLKFKSCSCRDHDNEVMIMMITSMSPGRREDR